MPTIATSAGRARARLAERVAAAALEQARCAPSADLAVQLGDRRRPRRAAPRPGRACTARARPGAPGVDLDQRGPAPSARCRRARRPWPRRAAGRGSAAPARRGPPRPAAPSRQQAPAAPARTPRRTASGAARSRARARSRAGPSARSASASSWKPAVIAPVSTASRGEEVGRAHQHADLPRRARPAARRPWRPSPPSGRRGCRRRSRIVAVGERLAVERARASASTAWLPQDEARPRPDVAAALAPLEDEPARAVSRNELEQAGRGDVQVGRDARAPPARRAWSGRPPAISANGGRWRADDLELLVPQLGGHEAEDARRPTGGPPSASARLRRAARRPRRPRMQGEREERQAAGLGHRRGELGTVADARHRPLDDRVARAVRPRRAARPRRAGAARAASRTRSCQARAQRHDDAAHRAVAAGERRRERGVLAEAHEIVLRGGPAGASPDERAEALGVVLDRPGLRERRPDRAGRGRASAGARRSPWSRCRPCARSRRASRRPAATPA